MQMLSCKSQSSRVGGLLKLLIPAVQKICISDLNLPKDQQNPIFQEFYNTLIRGAELVKKCEDISSFNLPLNYRYASQFIKLEKEIDGFMGVIPAHILLEAKGMLADLRKNYPSEAIDISKELENSIFKQASMLTSDACQNAKMLQQPVLDDLMDCSESIEDSAISCHSNGSGISQIFVGLEKPIGDVKEILFNAEVSVVGVQCMGGGGKTTLALALCDDPKIKGHYGNNVFFFTVSQSPNLKGILESMWEKIVGKKKPDFQNVEDAQRHLAQQLLKVSKPTLVILDDVWSRASLEKLLFEGPGYKTLITTRDSSTIPRNFSTQLYQLPLLGHEDALSLFCFWAFGQTSIPCTADANLVKEVQAECKGLPLALKVTGSSLHGEPRVVWESAKTKLSKGESISDYHKEGLFKCLETSVYLLDDVVRECFLDLGAFPEDKRICADALLDVWVYFRNLEWQDALAILLELASRNLLNLTSSNPGSGAAISHGSVSELYFTQHDVMRDLALYLGCQGDIVLRKRLLMPRKEYKLPEKWAMLRDRQFDAQIVSIHTGPMDENQWYEMNFPEAEVLILLFTASEYYLPPFLKSMKKLKFLMVFNYGTKRATVKGLETLSSLTQLKSVRLERVIAPAVLNQSKALQNLEKLSLSLCEGFKNPSTFNNTKLQGFNMDHCSDLEELPQNICYMPYAQMWSITNCHQVQKLPYDLGNLSSLKVLRLSALPGLKELPSSIGNLGGLEYLDISVCVGLKELPEQIGQLKKLTELDMRECSRLKRLPRSVLGLTSLKHVTCDEKIGKQWLQAKRIALPELRVEIVEVQFNLDWLDD